MNEQNGTHMFAKLVVICIFHLWGIVSLHAKTIEEWWTSLVEIILVQLPDKACEIGVLEHTWQY
jgi:hypothetical protein